MNPEPRKFSVLIVEDEVSLRNALRDKFIREGFSASDARDGEAGLEAALKALPDIILLDMVMPKMDGIAMLVMAWPSGRGGTRPVGKLAGAGLGVVSCTAEGSGRPKRGRVRPQAAVGTRGAASWR